MRVIKLMTIALSLMIGACAPKAIVVESITPAATDARGKVDAVRYSSNRTGKSASDTAKRASETGVIITKVLSRTEIIRANKKPGTQDALDWEEQWKLLSEIGARNLLTEEAANSTLFNSKETQFLANDASKSLKELEVHAKITDRNTSKITTDNAKLSQDAGTWRDIKKAAWTLIILGIIAALIIWGVPLIRKSLP